MQSRKHVQVVEVDANGSIRRSLGPAFLVSPDVVVMRVVNRDSTPTLPLHVLVPVAAGGDRDEHAPIKKIWPATTDEGLWALELQAPLQVTPEDVTPVEKLQSLLSRPGPTSLSAQTEVDGTLGRVDWLCRVFRLCR